MPSESTPIEYRTSDMLIAILLSYYEFKLIKVDRITQKKSDFVFEDDEARRQDIMTKFANNQIKTDPQKWENIRKKLKTYLLNYY